MTSARQQLVRADDDVDRRRRPALRAPPSTSLADAEARQLGDLHRPVGEAVGEGLVVLLGEQRGRARAPRPACRPATATNAARSATSVLPKPTSPHTRRSIGLPARHVRDHRVDRRGLVGRLLEAEAVGERLVVVRLERERVALARRALRVEVEQLGGGVAHLLRRPCASPCPTGRCRACAAAPPRAARRCSGRSGRAATTGT